MILYDTAMSFLNVPYLWAGSNPLQGLDCSGLVQCILASVGMDPRGDQTAHALWDRFRQCEQTADLGALAFYGNEKKIIHVGFMIDNWRMVEAGGGGHLTTSFSEAMKQGAYVRVRPIDYRMDFVGTRMPDYRRK